MAKYNQPMQEGHLKCDYQYLWLSWRRNITQGTSINHFLKQKFLQVFHVNATLNNHFMQKGWVTCKKKLQ